jgi:hypothetical protein
MAIYYPPVFINKYLQEKVREEFRDNPFDGQIGDLTVPFFPTSPTDIESLTQGFPANENNGLFAVYDRMFKMRRKPFPHIKSEQLLYYFYKTAGDPVALIETSQVIQDLLDRGDESAQELNQWIDRLPNGASVFVKEFNGNRQTKRIDGIDFLMPYFHEIKIYQLEETRDIIDFGTARTFAGNKIIIDYDWHKS